MSKLLLLLAILAGTGEAVIATRRFAVVNVLRDILLYLNEI